MRRKETVEHFLAEANNTIRDLENNSWTDDSAQPAELDQAKVFSVLTQLKRCLEAVSNDIYEVAFATTLRDAKNEAGRRGHSLGLFPYGKTQADFNSRVSSTHPRLRETRRDLYDLLESVQPHKLWKSTICHLCELRNEAEHDILEQKITPTDLKSFSIGNAIRMTGSTNSSVTGVTVNGRRAPDFTIDSKGDLGSITGDRSMLTIKRKNKVTVNAQDIDLPSLLKDAYQIIYRLQKNAYSTL